MHECILVNEELKQEIIISEGTLWIYDSHGEFTGDFDISFCPKCGIHFQPERTSEKARKGCDVPNTPTKGSEPSRND